jgi:serine/threonine-protein kinase RsbW
MGRSELPPVDGRTDIDEPSRFLRTRVPANARSAALARADFGAWLGRHFTLGAERFSDLLLAVNEAIANAAEFAYADSAGRGTVDISAAYDGDSDTLAVTVHDQGRWRQHVGAHRTRQLRGRGIPLMEALADDVRIDRTPQGTQVTLTWMDLTRRGPHA